MIKPSVELAARLVSFMIVKGQVDTSFLAQQFGTLSSKRVSAKKLYYIMMRDTLCPKWLLDDLIRLAISHYDWLPSDDYEVDCFVNTLRINDINTMPSLLEFLNINLPSHMNKSLEKYLDYEK